jgi:hypothetical protein
VVGIGATAALPGSGIGGWELKSADLLLEQAATTANTTAIAVSRI